MWYDSLKQFSSFLKVMIAAVFDDVQQIVEFIDNPQLYDDEYTEWANTGYPTENDKNWDDFIAAISSDDEDEESEE